MNSYVKVRRDSSNIRSGVSTSRNALPTEFGSHGSARDNMDKALGGDWSDYSILPQDSGLRGMEPGQAGIKAVKQGSPPADGYKSEMWGIGSKVLLFTMDSLDKTVQAASRGGPAGEIKIRESLTTSLREAGVQVIISRRPTGARILFMWFKFEALPIAHVFTYLKVG